MNTRIKSKKIKEIWHDPVWSKVIAGTILALATIIATYFFDWWPIVCRSIEMGWNSFLKSTPLPNWVITVLVLLAISSVFFLLVMVRNKLFPSNKKTSTSNDYKLDQFFGLRWRWGYYSNGVIRNLTTYCFDCDYQLYAGSPPSPGRYKAAVGIAYRCEVCGFKSEIFDEYKDSFEDKVVRLIQQKIRNGGWEDALKTIKQSINKQT
jgi:hypothetical protein